ncbi:MAG TPA: hypothetical protein VJO35_06290 [Terriglobales bacterium]|nr:hypothetical protein [Terriglobales bacterium]
MSLTARAAHPSLPWARTSSSNASRTIALDEAIAGSAQQGTSQPRIAVILSVPQASAQCDINGLAGFLFATGKISANVAIVGSASAGSPMPRQPPRQLGPGQG